MSFSTSCGISERKERYQVSVSVDVFLAEVSAGAGGSSQVMEAVGSFYGVGYGILADAGDVGLHVITFFFGEQFYRLQDFFTGDW